MLLVIAHNNGDRNPPEEAVHRFGSGIKFRHFHSANLFQGYRYWAQLDIAGTENLAVTRPSELQWVEFDTFKIGG